jgi:REP element-mobilizing transposase RayT
MDGLIRLNRYGEIVQQTWNDLPNHYAGVQLDMAVVMPNHFHGIIWLIPNSNQIMDVGAGFKPAPTTRHAFPEIVRGFKTFSSRHINVLRATPGVSVWQRNYYERIVRNEDELFQIRQYIQENPLKWDIDPENPNQMPDAALAQGS